MQSPLSDITFEWFLQVVASAAGTWTVEPREQAKEEPSDEAKEEEGLGETDEELDRLLDHAALPAPELPELADGEDEIPTGGHCPQPNIEHMFSTYQF